MQIDCETESVEDDPGAPETIAGKEVLGFLVGVSLLAPVAMVQADCYARFEDGSASCPDFRPAWDETTDPMFGSREKLTGFLGEATVRALERLNSSIVRALVAAKLMILDSELARARLPGFRAGEGAFVGQKLTGHSIRVQDAFFFAGM